MRSCCLILTIITTQHKGPTCSPVTARPERREEEEDSHSMLVSQSFSHNQTDQYCVQCVYNTRYLDVLLYILKRDNIQFKTHCYCYTAMPSWRALYYVVNLGIVIVTSHADERHERVALLTTLLASAITKKLFFMMCRFVSNNCIFNAAEKFSWSEDGEVEAQQVIFFWCHHHLCV